MTDWGFSGFIEGYIDVCDGFVGGISRCSYLVELAHRGNSHLKVFSRCSQSDLLYSLLPTLDFTLSQKLVETGISHLSPSSGHSLINLDLFLHLRRLAGE